MKVFWNIASWIIGVVGVLVIIGFTEAEMAKVLYQELSVHVDTRGGNFFITQDEIEDAIINRGYVSNNIPIEQVDCKNLEQFFDQYPAIKKSQVYTAHDGKLFVQIEQRIPLARIFTKSGESFYIDEDGWLMPLSSSYSSRVPVVNGDIDVAFNTNYHINFSNTDSLNESDADQRKLFETFLVIQAINKDPFWDAQFTQLYFNDNGDLELIPRVGNHTIIIGNAQSIDDKLNTLRIFYKEGLNKIGWNAYASINLKYKDQVVCKKRTHYGNN